MDSIGRIRVSPAGFLQRRARVTTTDSVVVARAVLSHDNSMKTLSAAAGAIAAIALLLVHAPPGHAAAGPDLLVDWNAQALAAAQAEDRLLTLKGVRTAALMHLAIHDALNCTERRYRAYGLEVDEPGADAVAAATEAAYMVLLDQYPQQRAAWQRTRAKWLD